jgi:methanogenic corrinoid protein MtbC1
MMQNNLINLAEVIAENAQNYANLILQDHLAASNDFRNRYNPDYRAKYIQDTMYSFQFLQQAILSNSPALWSEYLLWLRTLMFSLHIPATDFSDHMRCFTTLLSRELPTEYQVNLQAYLSVVMPALQSPLSKETSCLNPENEWYDQALQYLDCILRGERQKAVNLIMGLVSSRENVRSIYLHILQPVQREVGRLWQSNRITVAHEHFATGIAQQIMSQMYPLIFTTEPKTKRFIATCVQGELHEIGLRMVTDLMELDGWDTWFLGANMPTNSIIKFLIEKQADILAISATMTFHLNNVEAIIASVRANPELSRLKIIVGGYPFIIDNELWKQMGADGFARDAMEAGIVANSLLHCGKSG